MWCMPLRSLVLSLLVMVQAVASVCAGETIRIAASEYPPYMSAAMEGSGLLCKAVRRAFAQEGIEVEFFFYPHARSFLYAKTGRYDATLVWEKKEERLPFFYFSDPLLKSKNLYFFHRNDYNFSWDAERVDYARLKGVRIGAIIGYKYDPVFQDAEARGIINVHRLSRTEQMVKMLAADHIDLIISRHATAHYVINKVVPDRAESFVDAAAIKKRAVESHLLISKKSPKANYFL